jgi:hypothetical protein
MKLRDLSKVNMWELMASAGVVTPAWHLAGVQQVPARPAPGRHSGVAAARRAKHKGKK